MTPELHHILNLSQPSSSTSVSPSKVPSQDHEYMDASDQIAPSHQQSSMSDHGRLFVRNDSINSSPNASSVEHALRQIENEILSDLSDDEEHNNIVSHHPPHDSGEMSRWRRIEGDLMDTPKNNGEGREVVSLASFTRRLGPDSSIIGSQNDSQHRIMGESRVSLSQLLQQCDPHDSEQKAKETDPHDSEPEANEVDQQVVESQGDSDLSETDELWGYVAEYADKHDGEDKEANADDEYISDMDRNVDDEANMVGGSEDKGSDKDYVEDEDDNDRALTHISAQDIPDYAQKFLTPMACQTGQFGDPNVDLHGKYYFNAPPSQINSLTRIKKVKNMPRKPRRRKTQKRTQEKIHINPKELPAYIRQFIR